MYSPSHRHTDADSGNKGNTMYYFECEFPNGIYMRVDNISKTEAKRLYRKAMARDFFWAAWDVM